MTNGNDIEKLFKTHYGRMLRMAVAILHDDDLARDIVHDVFASLLDIRKNGAPSAIDCDSGMMTPVPNAGYLLTSVRNRCLNHIRDCGIHDRLLRMWFVENSEYDEAGWPDEETISRIYSLIRTEISPQGRRVIELRFGQGMPFAEIAREMGISETAVYKHMRHALTVIRQKLIENES